MFFATPCEAPQLHVHSMLAKKHISDGSQTRRISAEPCSQEGLAPLRAPIWTTSKERKYKYTLLTPTSPIFPTKLHLK